MNRSINEEYQSWPQMILLFLALWFISSYFVIPNTWQWFTNWEPFDIHWPFIWESIWGLTTQNIEPLSWYWNKLIEINQHWYFIIHFPLPVFLLGFISLYLVYLVLWVQGGREPFIHIRGSRLYKNKLAVKHARLQHRIEKSQNNKIKEGLNLFPELVISLAREAGNFLVVGQQGSGKTTLIMYWLQQLIERNCKILIFDIKNEFTQYFFNPKTTILIAPWLNGTWWWNISKDIKDFASAQLFATTVLFISHNEKDSFWLEAAQTLLIGMLMYLVHRGNPWSWRELSDLLKQCKNDDDLLKTLLSDVYDDAANLIQKDSKTTLSIYMKLITKLNWIHTLADNWQNSDKKKAFSVNAWLNHKGNKKNVIIQGNKSHPIISKSLTSAIFAIVSAKKLSSGNKEELFYVNDELANTPSIINALNEFMSLGRALGCRTIGGTQSLSQLHELLGVNNTNALFTLFATQAVLRHGEGQDAEDIAKNLGFREIEVNKPMQLSNGEMRDNFTRETYQLVLKDEVCNLPQPDSVGISGYLRVNGWSATYLLKWPYPKLIESHLGYVKSQKANNLSKQSNLKRRKHNNDLINDIVSKI